MKCGDKVVVMIEGIRKECQVYGEIYEPKYWNNFHPGPSRLTTIEVYNNQQIYEFSIEEVLQWIPKGISSSEE